ncbi:MAG: hypothetical protein F4155_12915 [Acidimicrobiales bacterium]|nr:hypothetical protein [Acidimicrobiales bacterium]MYH75686.1 hypothetical protein [Acidimicrobiales bacterium]MYK70741.1 hypothetical protein [Acidimicrobiales bacterium]
MQSRPRRMPRRRRRLLPPRRRPIRSSQHQPTSQPRPSTRPAPSCRRPSANRSTPCRAWSRTSPAGSGSTSPARPQTSAEEHFPLSGSSCPCASPAPNPKASIICRGRRTAGAWCSGLAAPCGSLTATAPATCPFSQLSTA